MKRFPTMSETAYKTIPFPAAALEIGDQIIDYDNGDTPATVTAIETHPSGDWYITLDSGAEDTVEHGGIVDLVVPVLSAPGDGVSLYKADGSGVLGCTCVYRLVNGEWVRVADSDRYCTALGHGAFADDEWD
jgi:hypothetical protein